MRMNELPEAVGRKLGPSEWHLVDQDRVNGFAAATNDHQWIHTDADRAAETPFGGTVAHGYLTLSFAPALLEEILAIDDCGMVINYGANKVRFPAPLRVGARLRMAAEIASAETTRDGATQVVFALSFEADGTEKPVCVAEIVFRYYPGIAETNGKASTPSETETASETLASE